MRIVFATGNKAKIREASEILGGLYEILIPEDFGLSGDIAETGETLQENSLLKAQYIYDNTGRDCFADDTGLEVDILGGAPGVHTARYAGESKDFNDNMDKLLVEMARARHEASLASQFGIKTVHATRKARFRTVITLILDGKIILFNGTMEGSIALSKSGKGGFGYDPVFIPDEIPDDNGLLVPNTGRLTAADITEEQKNIISHRGKALRAMTGYLRTVGR